MTSAASFRSSFSRRRELEDLHLALEVRPELLERDGVLRVVLHEAVDLDRRARVVDDVPEVGRQGLVGLLVEAELGGRAGLVPAGVVVVAGGVVEAELHVVVGADPLGRVDDAALERRVDLAARREHHGAAGLGDDLAAEARDAHLQPLEVARSC